MGFSTASTAPAAPVSPVSPVSSSPTWTVKDEEREKAGDGTYISPGALDTEASGVKVVMEVSTDVAMSNDVEATRSMVEGGGRGEGGDDTKLSTPVAEGSEVSQVEVVVDVAAAVATDHRHHHHIHHHRRNGVEVIATPHRNNAETSVAAAAPASEEWSTGPDAAESSRAASARGDVQGRVGGVGANSGVSAAERSPTSAVGGVGDQDIRDGDDDRNNDESIAAATGDWAWRGRGNGSILGEGMTVTSAAAEQSVEEGKDGGDGGGSWGGWDAGGMFSSNRERDEGLTFRPSPGVDDGASIVAGRRDEAAGGGGGGVSAADTGADSVYYDDFGRRIDRPAAAAAARGIAVASGSSSPAGFQEDGSGSMTAMGREVCQRDYAAPLIFCAFLRPPSSYFECGPHEGFQFSLGAESM